MRDPRDRIEELVFECLEALGDHGSAAVDDILVGQSDAVRDEVCRMLAALSRVGLAGDESTVSVTAQPTDLGPYRLLARIGAGAMGVVYRARRADDGTGDDADGELALKLLQPGLLPLRGTRVRFQREIEALRELAHPGICPILDDGEIDGVPYLCMPFVPGTSLREWFADVARGSDAQRRDALLAILHGVALALHHAHERGFVHRDVKPTNVIVRPDGQPVLLDFGLARLEKGNAGSALTVSGGVVGTPAYMAPEQVAGRADVDRRCDVYALGAVLYEGLTGRLPHEAPTRESLYRRILSADIERPSTLVRTVPTDLDVVCLTALDRDPSRRYQTALAFAEDLDRVRRAVPPAARLPGALLRTRRWLARNPLPATLLFGLLVALVSIAGLMLTAAAAARQDRARTMAAEAMVMLQEDPEAALAHAIVAHDLAAVPPSLTAIQAALVTDRPEFVFTELDGAARQLEFSADGQHLLAGCLDGTARCWRLDRDAGRAPQVVRHGDAGPVFAALRPGLNANGEFVTGGADGRICAWRIDSADRRWERTVSATMAPLTVLCWAPDGQSLLTGCDNGSVRLWTAAGELRTELPSDGGAVHTATWLDATTVALGIGPAAAALPTSPGHRVQVWHVPWAGKPELHAMLDRRHRVLSIRAHPDLARRRLLLIACESPVASLWQSDTATAPGALDAGFGGPVVDAGWSPDGRLAFTAARGGRVAIWSEAGEARGSTAATDRISAARANPSLPYFAVCGQIGNVELMSFDGQPVRTLGRRRLRGAPLAFSRDGTRLAVVSWNDSIQVWNLFDSELPLLFAGGRVLAATWVDGGRGVVTGGGRALRSSNMSGALRTWDAATGRQRDWYEPQQPLQVLGIAADGSGERIVLTHGRGLQGYAQVLRRHDGTWQQAGELPDVELNESSWTAQFLGDGRVLLCDLPGEVLLWDATTGTVQRLARPEGDGREHDRRTHWVAACATLDGGTVWAGGAAGDLHRFDRESDGGYREAAPIRIGECLLALRVLPDGSLLIGGANGLLQHRRADGTVRQLVGHLDNVRALDWMAIDGAVWIASGDRRGVVRLWSSDGELVREIAAHDGGVFALDFSPDGTRLLSGSADGTARIWPVSTADLLRLARRRVQAIRLER